MRGPETHKSVKRPGRSARAVSRAGIAKAVRNRTFFKKKFYDSEAEAKKPSQKEDGI